MVRTICDEPLARSADLAGADLAGADLAGADLAATVPARRRGAARSAYNAVYPDAALRLSRAIANINADPVFREAVIWQNPGLAQRLHNAGAGVARRTKDRQREIVVAGLTF
jgi:hypothetical protein